MLLGGATRQQDTQDQRCNESCHRPKNGTSHGTRRFGMLRWTTRLATDFTAAHDSGIHTLAAAVHTGARRPARWLCSATEAMVFSRRLRSVGRPKRTGRPRAAAHSRMHRA